MGPNLGGRGEENSDRIFTLSCKTTTICYWRLPLPPFPPFRPSTKAKASKLSHRRGAPPRKRTASEAEAWALGGAERRQKAPKKARTETKRYFHADLGDARTAEDGALVEEPTREEHGPRGTTASKDALLAFMYMTQEEARQKDKLRAQLASLQGPSSPQQPVLGSEHAKVKEDPSSLAPMATVTVESLLKDGEDDREVMKLEEGNRIATTAIADASDAVPPTAAEPSLSTALAAKRQRLLRRVERMKEAYGAAAGVAGGGSAGSLAGAASTAGTSRTAGVKSTAGAAAADQVGVRPATVGRPVGGSMGASLPPREPLPKDLPLFIPLTRD